MSTMPNQIVDQSGNLHSDILLLLGENAKKQLEGYLADRKTESASSQRARSFAIIQLANWCREQNLRVHQIKQEHLASLEKIFQSNRSQATARNLINRICNFLTWLAEHKSTTGNPAQAWMEERRLRRRLPSLDKRDRLPAVIQAAGPQAEKCYCEFFVEQSILSINRRTSANAFTAFCEWCEQQGIKFMAIDGEVYKKYSLHLAQHRTKSSLYAYLQDIRRVFSWLVTAELFAHNPFEGPATHPASDKIIVEASVANLEHVLKTVDEDSLTQLRDRACIALSVYCFLSGYELEQLNISNYQSEGGRTTLRLKSKGYRSVYDREVTLDQITKGYLDAHLAAFNQSAHVSGTPILRVVDKHGRFVNGRLHIRAGRDALQRQWRRAFGCIQPSIKTLRSLFVKHLLAQGQSMAKIASQVGLDYRKLCRELTNDLKEASVSGRLEDALTVPYELMDAAGSLPAFLANAGTEVQAQVYEFINRRSSKVGRKAYATVIGEFCQWCTQIGLEVKQFDEKTIAGYITVGKATSGKGTNNNKAAVLRALHRHLSQTTVVVPQTAAHPGLPSIVQSQIVAAPSLVQNAGPKFVESFNEFMINTPWSYTTIQQRGYQISQFSNWVENMNISLADLTYQHIQRFISDATHKVSLRHAEELMRGLRALFDWFMEDGLLDRTPIPSSTKRLASLTQQHRKKEELVPLNDSQIEKLFNSFDRRLVIDLRDRALVGIMLFAFAHARSVRNLNVGDYYELSSRRWLRLVNNDLKYEVPVHSRLAEYIEEYIEKARIRKPGNRSLIRAMAGPNSQAITPYRLTPAGLTTIVKNRLIRSGIENPQGVTKLLRLTGLMALLKAGATLEEVQALGGFKGPKPERLWQRPADLSSIDLDTMIMATDQSASGPLADFVKQSGVFKMDLEHYRTEKT